RQCSFVSGVAPDGAQDVELADLLGPLPDRVTLRVAQLPRERPVLAVPVAAVELDGLARGLDAEPAQPHLRGRDEDAPEAVAVARAGRRRALEAERERSLELGEEIDELLADQWEVDEQPALRPPVMRPDRALEERATGNAETHERDTEAGAVDHLHHPAEPAGVRIGAAAGAGACRAQRVAERVVEL